MAPVVSCSEVTRIDEAKSAFIRSCFQAVTSPEPGLERAVAAELWEQSKAGSITSGYLTPSFESSREERRIQPTDEKVTRLWKRWGEMVKKRGPITSSTPKSEGHMKRVYKSVPDVRASAVVNHVTTVSDESFKSTSTPVVKGHLKNACKRVPERQRRLSIKKNIGNSKVVRSKSTDEVNRNPVDKITRKNNLTVDMNNARNSDMTNRRGIDMNVRKSASMVLDAENGSRRLSENKQKRVSMRKTDSNKSLLRIKKNIGQRMINVSEPNDFEKARDHVGMDTDSGINSNSKQSTSSSSESVHRLSNSPTCWNENAIHQCFQDSKMSTRSSTPDSCVNRAANAVNHDCLIVYDPEPLVIVPSKRNNSGKYNDFIDSELYIPVANKSTTHSIDIAAAENRSRMYISDSLQYATQPKVRRAEIRRLTTSRSSTYTTSDSNDSPRSSWTSDSSSSLSSTSPPSYLLPSSFTTSTCRDVPSRNKDWRRRPVVSTSDSDIVRYLDEPASPFVHACTDRSVSPTWHSSLQQQPEVDNTKLMSGARYHSSQQVQPERNNTKLMSEDGVNGFYSDGRCVDESMTEFLENVNKDNLASLLQFYDSVTSNAYEKRQRKLFRYDVLYN